MLNRIKKLITYYDRKFFAWLEGKGTSRSKRERTPREDRDGRTQVSQRGVGPKRHAPQVPDPWD
jgi:hypothetical protein